jgi:predicted TIM-barrel fold metal-dependent hydrolase
MSLHARARRPLALATLLLGVGLGSRVPGQAPPGEGPEDLPRELKFDPARMRSRLVVPVTPVQRFATPVVDTHSHAYRKDADGIAAWVRLQDEVGLHRSFVLTGATGEKFRELSAQYAKAHPGRFVMFAGFEKEGVEQPDYGERVRRQLRADVAAGAAGLGELTDKGLGFVRVGERAYYIDDARFDPLWDEAAKLGVPVFVHIAEPSAFYDPADESNELRRSENWLLHGKGTPGFAAMLEKFERVLSRHPRTRFVSVHAFNLANDLGAVGALLDRHPNVQVDFAARMWELARQPFTARRFFGRYQDRILFGTDMGPERGMYLAHARQLETEDEWFWPPDAEWWRGYGMSLPADVLRKVYRTNAERLLAASASGRASTSR